MRTKHLVAFLVLLVAALPASSAQGGGVVAVCDEAHLLAALAGGGTVTFACSGTITLTAEITIAANTTLDGSGQAVTLSGNRTVRVFTVNSGITLNLQELTIANGKASGDIGGGIRNNGGRVNVINSIISGNRAGYEGGGIHNGIHGTVNVISSILSDNSSGTGGGIHNNGTVTVTNSTFFGNLVANGGGGIYNRESSTVTVSNSTFFSNRTDWMGGGGIANSGTVTVSNSTFSNNIAPYAGAISNRSTLTLKNTIVANSLADGNCYNLWPGSITDGGGNLSFPDSTCPGINADPLLGPLQNNLGPTETMALGPGSAAIDAGVDAICAATPVNDLDQRGIARPWGPHCDIGAVEQVPINKIWLPIMGAR